MVHTLGALKSRIPSLSELIKSYKTIKLIYFEKK